MYYPLDKYRFYVSENQKKVVAVTTYAGKPVRGVAVCAPEDTFDIETGKRLAAARCAVKVAKKRFDRAQRKHGEAYVAWVNAEKHLDDMADYEYSSENAMYAAQACLDDILEGLGSL